MSVFDNVRKASPGAKKLLTDVLVKIASDLSELPDVRGRAIFCLQNIEAVDRAAEILRYLGDSEPIVQCAAALAVAALQISAGYNRLVHLLKDPTEDTRVRYSAAKALRFLGNSEACKELLKVVEEEKSRTIASEALSALADLDGEAVYSKRVIPLLKHEEAQVRSAAARYFQKHVVPEAITPLIDGLNDPDEISAAHEAEALEQYVWIMRQQQKRDALNRTNEHLRRYETVKASEWPAWYGGSFHRLKRVLSQENSLP